MKFDKYFIQHLTFPITVTPLCLSYEKLKPTPLQTLEDKQNVFWELLKLRILTLKC